MIAFAFSKRVVDTYYHPHDFLENVAKYKKDTKILLDNNFPSDLRGIDIAKQLHAQGYTQLYLLSGENFQPGEVPDYLTVIMKTDIDRFKEL
jgi:hypothetical protein